MLACSVLKVYQFEASRKAAFQSGDPRDSPGSSGAGVGEFALINIWVDVGVWVGVEDGVKVGVELGVRLGVAESISCKSATVWVRVGVAVIIVFSETAVSVPATIVPTWSGVAVWSTDPQPMSRRVRTIINIKRISCFRYCIDFSIYVKPFVSKTPAVEHK